MQTREQEKPQEGFQGRIIQAYEQERLRLAREIHDGPAQMLANAIFELEYFERLIEQDPAGVRSQLAQLKAELRNGLVEVRRFIFDLRPPALGQIGFFTALRSYLLDFEKHFGIAVEMELPELERRLPASKEVAAFRIVQEALQNVRKHAGASRVVVRGAIHPLVMTLSVEDNGRGFDLAEVKTRQSRNFGLISMRERAELIDARLQIVTAVGQGTKIVMSVPLDGSAT